MASSGRLWRRDSTAGSQPWCRFPCATRTGIRVAAVRASYADFLWGLPPADEPLYPSLGLSTASGEGEAGRKVIFVSEDSPAARAGFQAGDVLLTLDGAPIADRETLNRGMADKRWGDAAVFTVRRGEKTVELKAVLRRQAR